MRYVPGRAAVAIVAALFSALLGAASASAFSIDSVTSAPNGSNGTLPASGATAAGAHPNFVTTITFNTDTPGTDSVRSLQIHLAPGVVAYVNHIPTCTGFDANSTTPTTGCTASVVGSTSTTASAPVLGTVTLPGTIYRIAPPAGAAAAFGIDITGVGSNVKLVATITVDPSNLGLVATLDNLPNTANALGTTLPIHINSITQTLNGYNAAGDASFFTNPTACIPAATGINATSYAGVAANGSGTYTPTDCANEPFTTQLTATADPATSDSTSAISVDVRPGTQDIPRVGSHVRNTTVVLPPGVLINSALAARLDACTDTGFNQTNTGVAANCPPSSAVGDINFISPILGQFPGRAYFGTSTPTDLLRLFLDVPLFGAHIKISAHVRPDPITGQITTIFDALPQIAFTDFQLTFRGGPQSALVTPTTCGTNTATAIVGPWSGGANSTPAGFFTTSGDGRGGPCGRTFAPTISAAVSTTQAGASPSFTLNVNRPDRTVPFRALRVSLPPGLIGKIALPGLTQCSLAQVAVASCPASSQIGTVASVVGSGSQPPTLPGTVYLAAPKAAGDPASLAIVVPAKLGPVDAGTVVVGARLTLRSDGGLDVISDSIPALQRGIPLAIQQLSITLNKPGFMQNPSSCGPQTIAASFDALDGGPGATASTQLTTTNCGAVRFAPQISASLKGRGLTQPGAHPAFTTVISQKVGEGAITTARVTLPSSISTNTAALLAGCTSAVYAANRCPKAAITATATAISPLVAQPLRGPVYLITDRGRVPALKVQLRGPVSIDLTGSISFAKGAGGLITTFNGIPDLALTKFQLAFHSGRLGSIAVVKNVCASVPKIAATFTAHSGRVTNQSHPIAVSGCPLVPKRTASLKFRSSAGTLTVGVRKAKAEKPLVAVSVTLPKTLKLTKGAISVKAGGKRVKAKAIKVRGRTVTISLGRKGVSTATVTLRKVHASSKALARKLSKRKGRLAVTVGTRDTAKHRTKGNVTLKLR